MLSRNDTVVVLIDFQEKLIRAMYEKEDLIKNAQKLVKGAGVLGLPIIGTEQNPKGLGATIPEIAEHIGKDYSPVEKISFSACVEERFLESLKATNRRRALVAGIESHVCVYQTAADLVKMGYEVQALADCVSSRTIADKAIGLERIKATGGALTSVETALFEILGRAEGDEFKRILPVIK